MLNMTEPKEISYMDVYELIDEYEAPMVALDFEDMAVFA